MNAQVFVRARWQGTSPVKESNWNIGHRRYLRAPFRARGQLESNVPGWLDQIAGGWQINYDVTHQSSWGSTYPAAARARLWVRLRQPQRIRCFDTSLWDDAATDRRVVVLNLAHACRTFPYLSGRARRPGHQNGDA
ncbi:MAG: hypothetical protein RMI94_08960 [Bryobacterales bacterium]|nr:hypothetical protein [Bryobacteraceae bacterium]MDW8130667.1 hypothetical protein [Bryobacterales bacterium]